MIGQVLCKLPTFMAIVNGHHLVSQGFRELNAQITYTTNAHDDNYLAGLHIWRQLL
jgi:hypothetical protein